MIGISRLQEAEGTRWLEIGWALAAQVQILFIVSAESNKSGVTGNEKSFRRCLIRL